MTLVAIMRPEDRLEESVSLARGMGFETICASPIDIEVRDSLAYDAFMKELSDGRVGLVIFSSSTAVQACVDLASRRGRRDELFLGLRSARVLAIGPVTSRRLAREGLEADGVPEEFTSHGMVAYVKGRGLGGECYVLRSDHGAEELISGLQEAGLGVRELVVYALRRQGGSDDMGALFEAAERGEVDVFLFTSSLSARTFVESWADRVGMMRVREGLEARCVAAIGPPTSSTLASYGVRVNVVPQRATFMDLMEAVKAHLSSRPG